MTRICVPHRGRWLLWSLNLPLGSAILHSGQCRHVAVNRLIAFASEIVKGCPMPLMLQTFQDAPEPAGQASDKP